jgi:sodium/bile acid cotransporter 7
MTEFSTSKVLHRSRSRLRLNSFIGGLAAAIILAILFPSVGARGGFLHTEITVKIAIFLIFLIQGAALRTETLIRGLLAWRVHVFIHAVIFVGIPLLTWLILRLPVLDIDPAIRAGFLLLSMLPTTISTAAAFTAQAGGNVTIAIFNSCVSNVLGILLVPLWIAWIFRGSSQTIPILPVLAEIALILLLPLLIGQIARPKIRSYIDSIGSQLGSITNTLILFIVFAALSNSFASRLWEGRGVTSVATALFGGMLLISIVTLLTSRILRLTNFSREDRITALFCASQKTLAAGIPIAQSIFGNSPLPVGLIVLPIMAYHISQLVIGAFLVGILKRSADSADG